MKPAYTYAATIENVVDADTVDVAIDLGFRVQFRVRVRVQHVDAYEHDTAIGKQATAWLKDLVASAHGACTMTTAKPDKYGRALAVIEVLGVDVGTELLQRGYAVPYEGGTKTLGHDKP